jgi:SAM-dependent methyltransferase
MTAVFNTTDHRRHLAPVGISEFQNIHNTDKFSSGYVDTFYNKLFSPIRYEVKNVLEIGIQYGPSILLWRDFFPKAIIHCVDIEKLVDLRGEERVNARYGDAYTKSFPDSLEDDKFDIIIDDGPHTYESQVFFLQNYLTKVKPGGYLVLEDIMDPSWTPNLLELINKDHAATIKVYDMKDKQQTEEAKANIRRYKGNDVIVVKRK